MSLRSRRIAFAVLMALAGSVSLAQAQGLTATVDKVEATIEDQILLVFEVEGSDAQPSIPAIPDFEVIPSGRSQHTQLDNGRFRKTIGYRFTLIPKARGRFTIPAASVEINGRSFSSRPIQIRIVDNPRGTSRDLFIQVEVSDRQPYVGQQVIYTWRFFYRVQLAGARLENQSWDGFLVEKLGDMKEYERVVQGQKYRVNEIKMALFPQATGKISIEPSRVVCDVVSRRRSNRSLFDDFFSRSRTENRRVVSPPVQLEVRELPPSPPEYTGLIGEFRIRSEVSKAALQVGESSTFTYSVSGRGNAMTIPSPPLPEFRGFKVYDDKPSESISRSESGVSGNRSFRKALVPLTAGELEVPPIRLVYFDPSVGAYRTAATSPISMIVTPSEGGEELNLTEGISSTSGKLGVKTLGEDILPLHPSVEGLDAPRFDGELTATSVLSLLSPPVAFGFFLVWNRKRGQGPSAKARQARKLAEKNLDSLKKKSGREALESASRLFRIYLGDRFDCEGAALTSADAQQLLIQNQLDEELAQRVGRLITWLEKIQYDRGQFDLATLEPEIRRLIQEIDRRVSR